MKKITTTVALFLLTVAGLTAQNNIGIGTTNPNPNAILEVRSNAQGLLIPRMFTNQRESMPLGQNDRGMVVYDLSLNQFMFFNGNTWKGISADTSRWGQFGNNIFRNNGYVGIGLTLPVAKFHVNNDESPAAGRFVNTYAGPNASYGLRIFNESENPANRYGIMSTTYGSTGADTLVGVAGRAFPEDEAVPAYGGYFTVDSSGTGTHYGVYAEAKTIGSYAVYANSGNPDGYAGYFDGHVTVKNKLGVGTDHPEARLDVLAGNKTAMRIENISTFNDTLFGLEIYVDSLSGSRRYGIYNLVSPSGTSTERAYGAYHKVEVGGTGPHLGVVGVANGDGNIGVRGKSSGTGYGVLGVNNDNAGYAGYFEGNGYVKDRLEIRDKIFLRPVGNGDGGEIELFDNDGDQTVTIRAGQSTDNGAELLMYNDAGIKTIELDAEWGNGKGRVITDELQITGGSDLAEHFAITPHATEILPGMVVSINPEKAGALQLSDGAYDKSVVGVISGANGVDPGMLMGHQSTIADGDWPVALAGRVYVLVDATRHPVRAGDLLTSAPRSGYAMAARKHRKAQGAILGKALTTLENGTGYVLMLVNLR